MGRKREESAILESLIIEVPIAPPRDGYQQRRVDCRLSPVETDTLHRIVSGLDEEKAILENGTRVVDVNTAIRYMLQQAKKQMG